MARCYDESTVELYVPPGNDDKRPPEPQNRPAGQQQHLTRTVDAWLCDKGGLRHVPGPVASRYARVRSEAGYHQHFRHRRTGLAVHEARSLYAHWIVARNQWDAAAQRSAEHNRATHGSRAWIRKGLAASTPANPSSFMVAGARKIQAVHLLPIEITIE